MARRKLKFIVEIDVDDDVTQATVKAHICNAVKHWGGGYHPCDPLFPGAIDVMVKKYHPTKVQRT